MKFAGLRGRQARKDTGLLLVVFVFLWWLSGRFDLFESLHDIARDFEIIQLDELLVSLVILSVGLIWFSLRRWQEQQSMAEALRVSEKRLADAQRLAHVGNWELNLIDNDLYWSDEVFRMFEIDQKQFEASYEAFMQTIHPEDRARVHQAYTDSVASHRPYGIEHRLLMPDGRIKYVYEWCETYYDGHGEPVRSVGTVQDISEIKELELQLFQSQKMEAIGTLVGGIAHDFNNILGAIEGNIYLAKLKSDSREVTAKLQAVEALERRAADMVSQLLAFARKDVVNLQVIRLNDFLGDAIALAGTAIPERIGLALDICDESLCVKGDLTQLQQVLLNLLNNARDALGKRQDGMIRCVLSSRAPSTGLRKRFPFLHGEQFACIEVEDNGNGIEPANIGRIFEPFFTTKDVGEGTGLGLSMVYGVVERAGGALDVQSLPGEGTVFRIYLPLVDEELEETVVHDLGDVVSGRGELVLVVDDEDEVRGTTAEVLRSLGYSVREAENGRKAVEVFTKYRNRVRLVVMDLVMPEMGGIAAAREIRAINARVPIIFATGYDKDRELPQEKMLSNSIVINKPFPFEKFSYLLGQLIDEDAI